MQKAAGVKPTKLALELVKTMRKDLFKNKKNVLKKGFYKGLTRKEVKKAIKEGALSGCSIKIL
jgi:hypothetical protein